MELLRTDTLEEAREKLEAQTKDFVLRTSRVEIEKALGRICAADVRSKENVPAFRRSTVDGYAVAASDTYGAGEAGPVFFKVRGHVRIEEKAEMCLGAQDAAQVQTGSMLPEGATAVVMSEYTENYAAGKIACCRAVSEGENVIRQGEDIREGECIIARGRRISAADIGMMASLGITELEVFEPLEVTVISTGDELADIREPLGAGKIRDINTYTLAAEAVECGMHVRKRIRVRDDREAIRSAVTEAAGESDIVLMSGGSSKGDKDYTRSTLEEVSHNVFTCGISIKPGKPTILAYDRERQTVLAGLPGHPMAAALMFRLLIADWNDRKAGRKKRLSCPAVMHENVSSNQGRTTCLPVKLEPFRDEAGNAGYEAVPVYAKSGSISALAKADGFIIIPRDREGLKKGEPVQAELL